MSENSGPTETITPVNYELLLTVQEAREGTLKLLPRNNKRLQVNIPPGVTTGSTVKLTNALQITDSRPGDIYVHIKIKDEEPVPPEEKLAGVMEINDSNFDTEVLKSNLPVVVDFWAPWCGPCKMMAPVMEKLAEQYQGKYKFCKINVDENPAEAERYQAMSIPMLLFFKNGQVIDKSVGALPESQLRPKLDSLLV
jgi:thioredoxin 1